MELGLTDQVAILRYLSARNMFVKCILVHNWPLCSAMRLDVQSISLLAYRLASEMTLQYLWVMLVLLQMSDSGVCRVPGTLNRCVVKILLHDHHLRNYVCIVKLT